MADKTDLWVLEQNLWLGGAEVFSDTLAHDCTMVFPEPAGVLKSSPKILASLKATPRWRQVEMAGRGARSPRDGQITLTYHAEARRDGQPPYRAECMSTYEFRQGHWKLTRHQQSPRH